MGALSLWQRIKALLVPMFWRGFCWASGYNPNGYVCDFPEQECLQWKELERVE